jgi:hypothetical protein
MVTAAAPHFGQLHLLAAVEAAITGVNSVLLAVLVAADRHQEELTRPAALVQPVEILAALPDILRTVNILAMQQGEAAAQAAQVLPLPHQTSIRLQAVTGAQVVPPSAMAQPEQVAAEDRVKTPTTLERRDQDRLAAVTVEQFLLGAVTPLLTLALVVAVADGTVKVAAVVAPVLLLFATPTLAVSAGLAAP